MGDSDAMAQVAGRLTSVAISAVPTGLVPGARILEVGGVAVSIDPARPVTDPASLDQFAGLAAFRPAATQDSGGSQAADLKPVVGHLKLAQPLEVSAVPPSSLFGVAGTSACVLADGAARLVTIVASELGRTFVLFDGSPPRAVSTQPEKSATCG